MLKTCSFLLVLPVFYAQNLLISARFLPKTPYKQASSVSIALLRCVSQKGTMRRRVLARASSDVSQKCQKVTHLFSGFNGVLSVGLTRSGA